MVTMFLSRTLTVLCVGLFLLGATGAAAQDARAPGIYNPNASTPIQMYFHINGLQDVPINTQKPDDRYASDVPVGLATHSQGCVNDPTVPALVRGARHTYYGFSSPGYVQYDVDQGGEPRYHPERGISFDVKMDASKPVDFVWYMQGQATGGDTAGVPVHSLSPPLPNVVMRATIREGDQISPGHTAFNTGEIIAQGQTEPALLQGAGTSSPNVNYVGPASNGAPIYEFRVPLEYQRTTIDAMESYNARIDFYMETLPGTCDKPQEDNYLMPDFLRVHTSPENRPGFTWHIFNPLRIEYLHPQFIGDDLVLHTSTNSPWGNYDVRGDQTSEDQGGLTVTVTGPSVPVSINRVALTARTHEHDHHTEAVDATWVWEYKKDGARDGLYTVTFSAKNDQETTEAIAVAQFEIGSGKIVGCGNQATGEKVDCDETVQKDGAKANQESPGIGFVSVLAVLGAALVALRRRK